MWSEQADLTPADICADLESGEPIVKVEVLQGDVKTDLFGSSDALVREEHKQSKRFKWSTPTSDIPSRGASRLQTPLAALEDWRVHGLARNRQLLARSLPSTACMRGVEWVSLQSSKISSSAVS